MTPENTEQTSDPQLPLLDAQQPVVETCDVVVTMAPTIDEARIDFDLALAIGHHPSRVRVSFNDDNKMHYVEVQTDTDPPTEPQWFPFSHKQPEVAWALAERYDCFPYKTASGNWTTNALAPSKETMDSGVPTAALAVALTVIQEQGL